MPAVVVLIKYKIVVFDEVYTLFHFNIILKHNGMSSTKTKKKVKAVCGSYSTDALRHIVLLPE